jgi:hypothetical protein
MIKKQILYIYVFKYTFMYIIYILKYMEHLPCSRLILLATAASPACDHCPIISCDFSAGVQCVERFELPFFAPYLHHMTHMTWDILGSVMSHIVTFGLHLRLQPSWTVIIMIQCQALLIFYLGVLIERQETLVTAVLTAVLTVNMLWHSAGLSSLAV